MGSITVGDLAQRLGGKVISAHHKTDRVVSQFLIGTMQQARSIEQQRRTESALQQAKELAEAAAV